MHDINNSQAQIEGNHCLTRTFLDQGGQSNENIKDPSVLSSSKRYHKFLITQPIESEAELSL